MKWICLGPEEDALFSHWFCCCLICLAKANCQVGQVSSWPVEQLNSCLPLESSGALNRINLRCILAPCVRPSSRLFCVLFLARTKTCKSTSTRTTGHLTFVDKTFTLNVLPFLCLFRFAFSPSSCCQCLRLSTATFLELCALLGQCRLGYCDNQLKGRGQCQVGENGCSSWDIGVDKCFRFQFRLRFTYFKLAARMICNLITTREFFTRISTSTAFVSS